LKKRNIKFLSGLVQNVHDELLNFFPVEMIEKIDKIIDEILLEEENRKYTCHYRKFQNLLNFQYQQEQRRNAKRNSFGTSLSNGIVHTTDSDPSDPPLVWNLSKRSLTEEERRVLGKGLTYNHAGPINRSKVISNIEHLFSHASGVQKELIDFKKWDEDPDNFSAKETRILEPKQLSLAADFKSATEKFLRQTQMSITTNRKKSRK